MPRVNGDAGVDFDERLARLAAEVIGRLDAIDLEAGERPTMPDAIGRGLAMAAVLSAPDDAGVTDGDVETIARQFADVYLAMFALRLVLAGGAGLRRVGADVRVETLDDPDEARRRGRLIAAAMDSCDLG